ncbi:hypothetical protein POV27_12405 [Aureisphaera galaxeae]|uniref:hypothetical protein n=1 Tax=Aureisphaera galaxeae TaxID=1538023 RepID=UPI002350D67C|nr:hypothetical protein [Aureisphaera galaxeae]MDC8004855.1 hypothetical protein [Aureisphaera galaxeae]
MKIRALLGCSLLFLFSSCATLFNGRTAPITFRSKTPVQITVNDSVFTVDRSKTIRVPRSGDSLVVTAKNDSLERQFVLQPRLSFLFYYNVTNLGLGFIVDDDTDLKYGYPRFVKLDESLEWKNSSIMSSRQQGHWNLGVSLPHVNQFYFQPNGAPDASGFGFFGVSVLGEYFYKDNKFINLTAGGIIDAPVPFPASVSYDTEYETHNALFISLTDNYVLNRFSVGYGANFSRYNWAYHREIEEEGSFMEEEIRKSSNSLGLSLNSYYRIGERFHVGLVYRPTFVKLNAPNTFEYEHSISIDLVWKWRIRR